MTLSLLPTQPPLTWAQLSARVYNLPEGWCGLIRGALNQPGTTADHLLWMAEGLDEARQEILQVFPGGCTEADRFAEAAAILREAAPLYPHPPRNPAAPIGAPAADRHGRTRA